MRGRKTKIGVRTVITYQKKRKEVIEWAVVLGVNASTLVSRLKSGWTVENAFEIPVNTLQSYTHKLGTDDEDDDEPTTNIEPIRKLYEFMDYEFKKRYQKKLIIRALKKDFELNIPSYLSA